MRSVARRSSCTAPTVLRRSACVRPTASCARPRHSSRSGSGRLPRRSPTPRTRGGRDRGRAVAVPMRVGPPGTARCRRARPPAVRMPRQRSLQFIARAGATWASHGIAVATTSTGRARHPQVTDDARDAPQAGLMMSRPRLPGHMPLTGLKWVHWWCQWSGRSPVLNRRPPHRTQHPRHIPRPRRHLHPNRPPPRPAHHHPTSHPPPPQHRPTLARTRPPVDQSKCGKRD
jgi:hypothetical protein